MAVLNRKPSQFWNMTEDSARWGSISRQKGKIGKKSIPVEKSTPDCPRDRSDGSRHVLRDVSRGIDSR